MIHELRIYTCLPGQLPRLLTRFETATLPIWKRIGIRPLGFWKTVIGPNNNDLTYLLEWQSMAERESLWSAFMADPEWAAAREASERPGPIVATIASSFLQPALIPAPRIAPQD